MTRKDKNMLVDVYNALCGVVSEMGPEFFDQYHVRGGETMMNEFEDLVRKVSPESFRDADGVELPDGGSDDLDIA